MELQVRKNVSLKLLDRRSLDQSQKSRHRFATKSLNYGLNESITQLRMIRFIKPGTGKVVIAFLDDFVHGFVRI